MISFLKIAILAAVQGAAELLPVSSSAHVIVAEKLMGLDPAAPALTMLLVMLHTGTMFAVIVYFWKSWRQSFFASRQDFWAAAKLVTLATALTGVLGLGLKYVIEKFFRQGSPEAQIELIFGNLGLMAASLAAVGLLVIYGGVRGNRSKGSRELDYRSSSWIGAVQGICLPFRGFSRSGATISVGLLAGIAKVRAEEFSFALAVVLTPPVVAREVLRLVKANGGFSASALHLGILFYPSLLGMVLSFIAGLLALRWLSRWLESGRWQLFGIYCLGASLVVFLLYLQGF
ncbi:MAG: undecaprenyl-diphosphate phosphatase [Desulfobacteraceae bacterium]|nr:undecaprenyl-diphosphate phosphatase [Desulfobacteraceae bacterium]